MDLDIVIVNRNSGEHLRRCLASIAASRMRKHRIARVVAIDNDSRDGSADGLFAYGLPLIVRRMGVNLGFGTACNLGAAMGHSPAVLFLNPDAAVPNDALEMSVSTLEAQRGVGIVGARLHENGQPRPSRMRFPTPRTMIAKGLGLHALFPRQFPDHFDPPQDESGLSDAVIGAFFLVRRTAFQAVGGFDERFFLYYEEIDLAQRMRMVGWTCFYHAGIAASHVGGVCADADRRFSRRHSRKSRSIYARRYFSTRQAAAVALLSHTAEPLLYGLQSLLGGKAR